jgi:hypothetical protein
MKALHQIRRYDINQCACADRNCSRRRANDGLRDASGMVAGVDNSN